MATAGLSPICYNHPEKKADFKCFDCKRDSVINLCPQCNIQVHSLDVFRAHRVEHIEVKDRERRLSQDVDDIEKLIAVESDILQNVLARLKYCEEEEKETISHLIQLQTATKKRIAEIKECETRIEKAFGYLTKVSTLLTQCSAPVEDTKVTVAFKDPCAPEHEATVPSTAASQQSLVHLAQEPAGETQNVLPIEPLLKLPDEITGKDVFPVSVVGSLARNGSFWMIKVGESDLHIAQQIHSGLRTYYHMHGYKDTVDVSVGAICAVLNRNSKEFCRVRIESIASSGMVKVRFLDLGFVENFQPSSLCKLPPEFLDIPFQALECCLLPTLDTQLPYEAKWCFKDLTFNKFLMAALEDQVTDSKGHTVNHVTLASCGESPVCINTKVTQLVEEQKLASEDRPIQPKAEEVENDPAVVEEISNETPSQTDVPSSLIPDACKNVDNREKTEDQLFEEGDKISVGDAEVPALSDPVSDNAVIQNANYDPPSLRAEAAAFVPASSSSDNNPPSKAPLDISSERCNIPGILHLPLMANKIVTAKPVEESSDTLTLSEGNVPEGCVDFAMYNHIISQCSLSFLPKEALLKARFFMVRCNMKRVIEAMKCGLWCSLPESGKKLNRVFNEQASKGGNPVYLLFSGLKSTNFCGMAKMESAIDPNINCPTSIKPYHLSNSLIGCCVIRWFYAQDLFFGDVLTPECGFHKRFLANCGDGTEIPNKLGQLIVRNYESCNYFRSILKPALQSYQLYLNEQEGIPGTVKPSISVQLQERDEGLQLPQEEDWDQEIEDSKAAKSLENESLDEIASEKKEVTKGVAVSETVVSDYSTEGLNSLGAESFNNEDWTAVSSVKYDNEVSSVKQDDVAPQESVSSVCLSIEKTNAEISETQSSSEPAASASAEAEFGRSAPDMVTDSESDWESCSPLKTSGRRAASETTECEHAECDSAVDEPNNIPPDTHGTQTHEENLQCGEAFDVPKTQSESVVYDSDVFPHQDLANEPTDKQTTFEQRISGKGTSQEDLGQLNGFKNTVELQTPQGDPGDLAVSNSLEVVTDENNPECEEEPSDSRPSLLISDDESKVTDTVTGENEVQEADSECGDQQGTRVSSQANGVTSQPAKPDPAFHGSSEDLLCENEDLPVEIGKEQFIYALESLSNNDTFWARVHKPGEDDQRFIDAMARMGAHIEANNKPLDSIFMYKHCAVRGLDNYWYRALVEETSSKGKVGIRLLDLGDYWEVDQKELRVLDDEFYVAPPAQAFECSVCYENPNNKKEKNRISRLVKRNRRLRVIVRNCSEGTVGVQILC